jgi:single-stranded DNA-binding protein
MAFGEVAERIAQLGKGDASAVVGALKPFEWQDSATHETRHGLNFTVSSVLSFHDIKKRRPKTELNKGTNQDTGYSKPYADRLYDDPLPF